MIEDDPSHQLSWMEGGEGEVDGDWEGEGGGGDTGMRHLLRSNSSRAHRTCIKFKLCFSNFILVFLFPALPLHLKDDSSTSLEVYTYALNNEFQGYYGKW